MIRFADNSYIEYTYSGSGEKLSVNYGVHYLPVLSPTGGDSSLSQESETLDDRSGDFSPEPFDNRISYCGNVVYDFGTTRLLTDEGYVTFDELTGTPQYHFYLRDHLGNNRVVMVQDGSLEQVTHYYTFAFGRLFLAMAESMRASLYSFGLSKKFGGVIRESTNPGLQPYKFGGKELDRTSGLDAYDFGARMYFPDRLQWGLMDPMCEKYYDWSPYGYCHGNPVNHVDPDGRHDYKLTQSGYLVRIRRTNSSFHTIFATNSNGTINKQISTNVSKSFLNSHYRANYKGRASENHGGAISDYTMDSYNTTDVSEGKQFFKFAADNTQVEWSYVEIQKKDESQAFVTTSHSDGDEIGLSVVVDEIDILNESISEATHSHSYDNGIPSQGDINLAVKVHKKSPSAKLFIYDRIRYNSYDEESQYDTLNELIVTPSP